MQGLIDELSLLNDIIMPILSDMDETHHIEFFNEREENVEKVRVY